MKKGILLEVRKKYAIVLTAEGSFEKASITDRQASIGQEVEYEPYTLKPPHQFSIKKKLLPIAIIIAFCICVSFYFLSENESYAYVNVEINPSIELKVNRDLDVHGVIALNEDANEIVTQLTQSEMTLEEMLANIMDRCEKRKLINEGKLILIGVSYSDKQDSGITASINEYFQAVDSDWEIVTFRVPNELREQAQENQISMNKEFALLIESGDETVIEDIGIDEEKMNLITSFYDPSSEPVKTNHDIIIIPRSK